MSMGRKEFIAELSSRLSLLGFRRNEIEQGINMYLYSVKTLTPDEQKALLSDPPAVDIAVENITAWLRDEKPDGENSGGAGDEQTVVMPSLGKHPSQEPSAAAGEYIYNDVVAEADVPVAVTERPKQPPMRIDYKNLDPDEGETRGGALLFWLLFVLALPITVPLAITVLSIFAAVYITLFALIAAFMAALIAVVIAGFTVFLVGIIYGLTRFGVSIPVALFETGLSIAVLGAVLLVSILLYNAAIRLLPFLVKKLGEFFAFVFKKTAGLFKSIRRRCAHQ